MTVNTGWVSRHRCHERDELIARRAVRGGVPADLGVRAVVVFGSVARGDFNKWSHVDVLVGVADCAGTPTQRHGHLGPSPW